jgi:hypothetical protein
MSSIFLDDLVDAGVRAAVMAGEEDLPVLASALAA